MKFRKLVFVTFILALGLTVLLPVKAEAAGKVKLNKTKVVIGIGETYQLKVKNTKKKVKWSTSNKKIVKVKNGRLTAISTGNAKVTAKVSGKRYTCRVSVADLEEMSKEQKKVVSYALQFVGNRYRYGGTSLTKGTDCSGFTLAVYKKFGYDLTHNAYGQLKETKKVKMKNIKPGDLIFYGRSKSSCSHVGIYIGDGKIVHASTYATGIKISDYDYRKSVGVGRVLKKETYPQKDVDGSISRTATSRK